MCCAGSWQQMFWKQASMAEFLDTESAILSETSGSSGLVANKISFKIVSEKLVVFGKTKIV